MAVTGRQSPLVGFAGWHRFLMSGLAHFQLCRQMHWGDCGRVKPNSPLVTPRRSGTQTLAGIAGVILITCAGCVSDTYTHSQFRVRSAQLKEVAFLPPKIKTGMMDRHWAMAPDASLPEEPRFRDELPGLIAAEFQNHGLMVKVVSPETSSLEAVNPIWNARMQGILKDAYGSLGTKAVRPEAKVLADHVKADGLIFLNVFAYQSTEGRKKEVALDNTVSAISALVTGIPFYTPTSQAIIIITLVDGQSGDVLWRTFHDFTSMEQTTPDQVVAEMFKKYPKP